MSGRIVLGVALVLACAALKVEALDGTSSQSHGHVSAASASRRVGTLSGAQSGGETASDEAGDEARADGDVHVDVLVVGAGPSGLQFAHYAQDAGRDVLVVDAHPHAGGRVVEWHSGGGASGPGAGNPPVPVAWGVAGVGEAGDEYDDEYGDLRDDDAGGGGGAAGRSLQWRRDALSLTTLHMGSESLEPLLFGESVESGQAPTTRHLEAYLGAFAEFTDLWLWHNTRVTAVEQEASSDGHRVFVASLSPSHGDAAAAGATSGHLCDAGDGLMEPCPARVTADVVVWAAGSGSLDKATLPDLGPSHGVGDSGSTVGGVVDLATDWPRASGFYVLGAAAGGASSSIAAVRYQAAALHRWLRLTRHRAPWPHALLSSATAITKRVLWRVQVAQSMWHAPHQFSDAVVCMPATAVPVGVDGTPADDSVPARLPCVYLDDVPHALTEHVVAMAARMLTGGADVGQPLVGSLGLEGGVTQTNGASSAEGMQQLAPTLRFGTEVLRLPAAMLDGVAGGSTYPPLQEFVTTLVGDTSSPRERRETALRNALSQPSARLVAPHSSVEAESCALLRTADACGDLPDSRLLVIHLHSPSEERSKAMAVELGDMAWEYQGEVVFAQHAPPKEHAGDMGSSDSPGASGGEGGVAAQWPWLRLVRDGMAVGDFRGGGTDDLRQVVEHLL